jgi:hypothetical protein
MPSTNHVFTGPLSNTRRRVPSNRVALGLVSTFFLVLFATIPVAGLRAEDKPQTADSPEVASPKIEVEFKALQLSEEVYQQNRDFFDSKINESPFESGEDFLKKLNSMKELDLLAAPKMTIRSGQSGKIETTREFPFPKTFDRDGNPTAWENRDLGVAFEIETSEMNGKMRLSGTFFLTEFLGYIKNGENGLSTPSFQTREAHILLDQPSGKSSLCLVPWQSSTGTLLSATKPSQNATSPAPTAKRLMLWIKTTAVED